MSLSIYIQDSAGNELNRKNQFLLEKALLEKEIRAEKGTEKVRLKKEHSVLVKGKKEHKYIKDITAYKEKEKAFLSQLNQEAKALEVNDNLPKLAKKLQVRLFKAERKVAFYKEYEDLTYDAELSLKQSEIEIEQIPEIIEYALNAVKELQNARQQKALVKKSDILLFENNFKGYKHVEQDKLKQEIKEIEDKYRKKLISKKAKQKTIQALKKTTNDSLKIKMYEEKSRHYESIIKNKKYELTVGLKSKYKAMEISVESVRRSVPMECENNTAYKAYFTLLFPGLGQLLNKQYIKAAILFLSTLFIYGVAIPYALGYGNYRGEGIAGLITLAEGGKRLDRSIIFMIEGIIALALLAISAILMLVCFKDALNVEKAKVKGIRVKSWIETKKTFFEDGFPFIVSMPALIIIVFIVLVPIMTTILLSFTGMDPKHQAKFGWIALSNYKMIVLGQGLAGSVFWKILSWTIIWTICSTTLGIFIGFLLAVILNNDRIKGKVLFRSIYLLPWAVPAFITILFFSILVAPNGAITAMLSDLFGMKISIKNNQFMARTALICLQGWLGSSYIFLLSTGVLQSISKDLYEAADIDGASSYRKLSRITIPLVLFQTAPLLVGQYTFNFNNFSIIYLFNLGGPFNPKEYGNLAGATDLLISYIYKLTLENQYQALGAAITVVVSMGLMLIAYIGFRNTDAFRREK